MIEWLKEHSFGVNHLSALEITFRLVSRHVIYQSRSLNIKPTLTLLKAKIRSTYQIESFIAEKNKELSVCQETRFPYDVQVNRGIFHLYNNHFLIFDLQVRLPGLARRNYFYPSSWWDFFSLRGRREKWGWNAPTFFPPPLSPPPPPPPPRLPRLCQPRRLRFRSEWQYFAGQYDWLGAKSDDCNHSHAVKGRESWCCGPHYPLHTGQTRRCRKVCQFPV